MFIIASVLMTMSATGAILCARGVFDDFQVGVNSLFFALNLTLFVIWSIELAAFKFGV